MIKSLTVKADEGLHIRMRRKDAEGHSAHIGTSAGRRGSMFDRWTADGSVGDPRSILPKVSFHRRKMDKFQLLVLMCVLTYVQAATVDYNQLVANVNRFKTNLNRNVVISFSSPANMQIFLLFFFCCRSPSFSSEHLARSYRRYIGLLVGLLVLDGSGHLLLLVRHHLQDDESGGREGTRGRPQGHSRLFDVHHLPQFDDGTQQIREGHVRSVHSSGEMSRQKLRRHLQDGDLGAEIYVNEHFFFNSIFNNFFVFK